MVLGESFNLLDKAFSYACPFYSADNIDDFFSGMRGIYNATQIHGTIPPNAANALIIAFSFDIRYCQVSLDANSESVFIRFGYRNNGTVIWLGWRQL